MFIMVLQQQWPTFIDQLPGAELRIFRPEKNRNVMDDVVVVDDDEGEISENDFNKVERLEARVELKIMKEGG